MTICINAQAIQYRYYLFYYIKYWRLKDVSVHVSNSLSTVLSDTSRILVEETDGTSHAEMRNVHRCIMQLFLASCRGMAGLSVGGPASFIGDSRQSLQGQLAMSCRGKSPLCSSLINKAPRSSDDLYLPCRATKRDTAGQGLAAIDKIWKELASSSSHDKHNAT